MYLSVERTHRSKIASLKKQIETEVVAPLKSLEAEESQNELIVRQLDALEVALRGEVQYSNLIGDIKNNLYKRCLWTSFDLQENKIVISGQVDDFSEIAKASSSLANVEAIKDVKLTSANFDSGSEKVVLSLSVLYDGSSYKKQPVSPVPSAALSPQAQDSPSTRGTLPVEFNQEGGGNE